MKRYSIIVRPYGTDVETDTVLCQVDKSPEGVAQVIRARHRYESVRVVENIERGEPSNTQWPTSGFPLTRCRGVSVRGS